MVDKNFLISEMKRFKEENGRLPQAKDMCAFDGYPNYKKYIKEFGSWNNAVDAVFNNEEDLAIKREIERDFLIAELRRFQETNNRLPFQKDMCAFDGYPSVYRYYKEFGSWNNAIKEILMPERDFLIMELRRFQEENGRLPFQKDMCAFDGYPSFHRYYKEFGSWNNAIKEISLKPQIDVSFFSPENLNLNKLYIIGYIIGDGSVSCDNQLFIITTENDKENLYDLYNYMNLDTKICIEEKKDYKTRYVIHKQCPQWAADLKEYGIVPNKSLISYIPLDYLRTSEEEAAICRGIFDSDGCITCRKDRKNFPPIFYVCGSKKLCEDYAYLLKKNCDIDCNISKNSENLSQIQIQGKKCQNIYDFLYGHENFYIKRKKDRFEKLLNGTFTLEDDNY
ncbi:homing endonuclease associated repeat-containing protein [Methanosarcina lacustris]|nr:LAGLIDADG family homing endonuclease [Methanosarcina lacustris]